MITVPEIIERTFYIALLHETVKRGFTLNPDDYLVQNGNLKVPTLHTEEQFLKDKKAIGDKFIYIFGVGNNQVRGQKELPRITLELKAYYPGDVGVEKYFYEKDGDDYVQVEYDYETKHTLIDVRLAANTQEQMRLLHEIMYRSLPARGYIKPYINDFDEWKKGGLNPSGNLCIEVGNYYDHPNLNQGYLEKVYTYEVTDGLIFDNVNQTDKISPIKDISCLLKDTDASEVSFKVI